jgi:hypothetical protein
MILAHRAPETKEVEMSVMKVAAAFLLAAVISTAQESGIHVRSIRVLATDP